jgi:thymidylate kinase
MWANWWIGWWTHLRKARQRGVVLFDRFHGDLLADPKRYRYGGPMWLASFATKCMPQPDLIVFLDAPPEVLLSRKQEVSRDALVELRVKYASLAGNASKFITVDASKRLEDVVSDVFSRSGELL